MNLTIALAGFVLMVLQSVLVRELSAALISCEITILIVVAAYWTGLSLGYAMSSRLSARSMAALITAAFGLHIGLVVVRLWPLAGLWLGLRGGWILAWLFALAVPLPLCYGALVPYLIGRRSGEAFQAAYRFDILGALIGLVLLGALSQIEGPWLWIAYLGAVAWLTWRVVPHRVVRALVVLAVAVYLPLVGPIAEWQTRQFYRRLQGIEIARILHQSDSPYQKVELLVSGDGQTRCFLNGLEYFNAGSLRTFNLLVSGVPAQLLRPRRVLIVGSGSMASVDYVRPYAESVTTVEIDRRVYDAGRRHLEAVHHLSAFPGHRLIIDDAKHFLRRTTEQFDLIILDLPAPMYIQTGLLYTTEFYELVRRRLSPGGAVALYASGWFTTSNPITRHVVASVAQVFSECYVVSDFTLGLTFVIAGQALPIRRQELAQAISRHLPDHTVWMYPRREALEQIVNGAEPMSLRSPRTILWINWWLLKSLWNPAPLGA